MKEEERERLLTGLLFDELGEYERRLAARLIAEDPSAAAFLREQQATADGLRDALRADAERRLHPARRAEVLRRAANPPMAPPRRPRPALGAAGLIAAAALLVIAVDLAWHTWPGAERRDPETGLLADDGRDRPPAGDGTAVRVVKKEKMVEGAGPEVTADADLQSVVLGQPVPGVSKVLKEIDKIGETVYSASAAGTPGALGRGDGCTGGFAGPPGSFRVPGTGLGSEAFRRLPDMPFATLSLENDTAGYARLRRVVLADRPRREWPSLRLEELLNYFDYDYPAPRGDHPLAVTVESAACPWEPGHRLVRVGVRAREARRMPPANLVVLVDVSGSMDAPDRLPWLRDGLRDLSASLRFEDRLAIVTYAADGQLLLPPTPGDRRRDIGAAIDGLLPGGSTNGEAGIRLAYRVAREHFLRDGVNRVILATDGDFNVGASSVAALRELVAREACGGIFLTVLGFGTGNYKDAKLEALTNRGDGSYHYVDRPAELERILVDRRAGALQAAAKNVKIQVEWNPQRVGVWRTVGYTNRRLATADFGDDGVDAGEIGVGETVTALFEVSPAGGEGAAERRYLRVDPDLADELCQVRVRYQRPQGERGRCFDVVHRDTNRPFAAASDDFCWAAVLAGFWLKYRDLSEGDALGVERLAGWGETAAGDDPERREFLELFRRLRNRLPARGPVCRGGATLRFVRLRHGGRGWDDGLDAATGNADRNFLRWYRRLPSVTFPVAVRGEHHPIDFLEHYPRGREPCFVYLTGEGPSDIGGAETRALRRYLAHGGLLMVDAGSAAFDRWFRGWVENLTGGKPLVRIASDDPVFRAPFNLPEGIDPLHQHGPPFAMGWKRGGHWSIFYHPGDMNDCWKDDASRLPAPVRGNAREVAYNVIHYAMVHYMDDNKRHYRR